MCARPHLTKQYPSLSQSLQLREPSAEGGISKQHTPLLTAGLGCVPGAQSTTDTFLRGEGEVACARRNMVVVTPWGLNSSFHCTEHCVGKKVNHAPSRTS